MGRDGTILPVRVLWRDRRAPVGEIGKNEIDINTAGDAAEAVHAALGMGAVNPFFSATMAFEVAETLRRAGEKDEALAALARAVDAVAADPASKEPSGFPLWDRMAARLDPARAGEAWAEHKARQLDDLRRTLRQQTAERVASPEWGDLAGGDPRYQKIIDATLRTCPARR